jgi:hypothetical protein
LHASSSPDHALDQLERGSAAMGLLDAVGAKPWGRWDTAGRDCHPENCSYIEQNAVKRQNWAKIIPYPHRFPQSYPQVLWKSVPLLADFEPEAGKSYPLFMIKLTRVNGLT